MKLSVIVASYGDDSWLELAETRACPSACALEPHEVIVLHGTGGTSLAQTRNEAASRATGDWLVFLDADDELAPGFLDAMRDVELPFDYLGPDPNDQDGERWGEPPVILTPAVEYVPQGRRPRHVAKIWPRKELREGNWLVIGTVIPRALFERVGGFKEWPLYEDWCLWQRCELAGAHIVEVPRAVYVAYADAHSRNRAPARAVKLATHAAIVAANYGPPDGRVER